MHLKTIKYPNYEDNLPQKGQHILAQCSEETILVYQAFNPRIASYAVANQQFGGEHYRFSRMSWIKPNFLWMMYRCGWAEKEAQKRVLAIEISKENFEKILEGAVFSSYEQAIYQTQENWKAALANSSVRLQWDPDHDPYGAKLDRRAVQLGLRGATLKKFATDWIISIQDITNFVLEQGAKVKAKQLDQVLVMDETVYAVKSEKARKAIALSRFEAF
ncbi:MAG: DUF4291 domain-containing protein [uncultured Aureispira sp.]|uniref:DUF4291 domain-containing protein n=1 Tax=uncultured Aureispira sp. TaxID=1331704 RepID=A0A6S6TMM8_9BACT|nr:MAG: DUF4291 domain-containing protein [uncultured Aureispira sp.]